MGSVTVVGSYIVALVMDTDRIPTEGETVIGRNYHETHGGKGSNMVVCAARLGADAGFLGKIGRDKYGASFLELLEREGIRSGGVLYSDTHSTAVGFIVSGSGGSNIIVIDRGANGDLTPDDVEANADLIEAADVIISPLEIPLETALTAARIGETSGTISILNPAPAEDLRGHDLSCVFAITPNETEARICLGLSTNDSVSDEEIASRLLELGVENVILTRGERGVLWASSRGLQTVRAPAVNVLDTVGAGDAFNAGFAVGLSERLSVIEAVSLGVKTASLSTEKRDTIDSYPNRDDVSSRFEGILITES